MLWVFFMWMVAIRTLATSKEAQVVLVIKRNVLKLKMGKCEVGMFSRGSPPMHVYHLGITVDTVPT